LNIQSTLTWIRKHRGFVKIDTYEYIEVGKKETKMIKKVKILNPYLGFKIRSIQN